MPSSIHLKIVPEGKATLVLSSSPKPSPDKASSPFGKDSSPPDNLNSTPGKAPPDCKDQKHSPVESPSVTLPSANLLGKKKAAEPSSMPSPFGKSSSTKSTYRDLLRSRTSTSSFKKSSNSVVLNQTVLEMDANSSSVSSPSLYGNASSSGRSTSSFEKPSSLVSVNSSVKKKDSKPSSRSKSLVGTTDKIISPHAKSPFGKSPSMVRQPPSRKKSVNKNPTHSSSRKDKETTSFILFKILDLSFNGASEIDGDSNGDSIPNGDTVIDASPISGLTPNGASELDGYPNGATGSPPNGATGSPPNGATGSPPNGATGSSPNGATGSFPNGATGSFPNGATGSTRNTTGVSEIGGGPNGVESVDSSTLWIRKRRNSSDSKLKMKKRRKNSSSHSSAKIISFTESSLKKKLTVKITNQKRTRCYYCQDFKNHNDESTLII